MRVNKQQYQYQISEALDRQSITWGYARVSTTHQDLEIQIDALKAEGIEDAHIFTDKVSGKHGVSRDGFEELVSKLQAGDTVVAYKLDRLGRSVGQVTTFFKDMMEQGVNVKTLAGDLIIDTTSTDKMTVTMQVTIISLFADMERHFILERTKAGIEKAKANGVKLGRKHKHEKFYVRAIEEYLKGGKSVKEVVSEFSEWDNKNETWTVKLTEPTFFRKLQEYKVKHNLTN